MVLFKHHQHQISSGDTLVHAAKPNDQVLMQLAGQSMLQLPYIGSVFSNVASFLRTSRLRLGV